MKMTTRSELRKIIMTCLYQIDILKQNNLPVEVDKILAENIAIDNEFVKDIVYGVVTSEKEIDTIANKYLKD